MKSRLIRVNNSGAGMFSMVKTVLCALASCEADGVSPSVIVGDSPYREKGFTGNVWDHFFFPVGDARQPHDECHDVSVHPCLPTNDCYFHNRSPMCALINKWVRPCPRIEERISHWHRQMIEGGVHIGVHFRGTDKYQECTFVHPRHYAQALHVLREASPFSRWLLCTDSNDALSVFSPQPGMLVSDSFRLSSLQSGYGVHFSAPNKSKAGDDAVLDAWLLSKCKILVCGPSNLSEFATYLNPSIVVVSLR